MKVVHISDILDEFNECKIQIAKIGQAVGFEISVESAIRQIQESLENLEKLAFDHDKEAIHLASTLGKKVLVIAADYKHVENLRNQLSSIISNNYDIRPKLLIVDPLNKSCRDITLQEYKQIVTNNIEIKAFNEVFTIKHDKIDITTYEDSYRKYINLPSFGLADQARGRRYKDRVILFDHYTLECYNISSEQEERLLNLLKL